MYYAEELKEKLRLHKETDLVDISTDIDDLLTLAEKSVDEYDDLDDEKTKLEQDKSSLQSDLMGAEEENELLKEEEIKLPELGLLGEQIKDAFKEIISHQNTNQVKFLQHLETFTLNGYK